MSWFVAILALLLLGLGAWAGTMALDLLPTELGLFYAIAAALAGCSGIITLAIAALIRAVEALGRRLRSEASPAYEAPVARAEPAYEPTAEPMAAPEPQAPESHAPETQALQPPAHSAPAPVGRYAANGVDYTIFADGTIEANTAEGLLRYGSMSELRAAMARNGVMAEGA